VVFRALALSFTLLSASLDLLFGWLDENLKERSRERKEPSPPKQASNQASKHPRDGAEGGVVDHAHGQLEPGFGMGNGVSGNLLPTPLRASRTIRTHGVVEKETLL
jgi:hypothetical protein